MGFDKEIKGSLARGIPQILIMFKLLINHLSCPSSSDRKAKARVDSASGTLARGGRPMAPFGVPPEARSIHQINN
jgi:hypothetical protein